MSARAKGGGKAEPDQPRLTWPGRCALPALDEAEMPDAPARLEVFETWGEAEAAASVGRLVLGDNLSVMAGLAPGSVRLCYLDPPFFSGGRYRHRVRLRDLSWEVPAFDDTWSGGLSAYLSFLEPRLRMLSRVLAGDGSLYLHLDASAVHYVKVLVDEIFGARTFSREIIWRIGWVSGFKTRAKNWVRNHDVILYYARSGAPFHKTLLPHPEGYARRGGGEGAGRPIEDVWSDIDSIQLKSFSTEKTGYATQKNLALLTRIIEASSDPGDLVLDPFGGAGSCAVAAAAAGRRFCSIDILPLALHQARRRLIDAGVSFDVLGEVLGEVPGEARDDVNGEHTLVKAGPLRARCTWTLAGPVIRLLAVPEASGPEAVSPLERLDAWWITEAGQLRPTWFRHRPQGRHPEPVAIESDPLALRTGTRVKITAVDLAGGHHQGLLEI